MGKEGEACQEKMEGERKKNILSVFIGKSGCKHPPKTQYDIMV